MVVAGENCSWIWEAGDILSLRLMLSAFLVWIDGVIGLAPLR